MRPALLLRTQPRRRRRVSPELIYLVLSVAASVFMVALIVYAGWGVP
jgi:hypothetical protein